MENNEKPKRKRKKRDLNISIDTPLVDIDIQRKDGVTDIEIDTPVIDVDIHKEPETKAEVDVKVEADGKFISGLANFIKRFGKK